MIHDPLLTGALCCPLREGANSSDTCRDIPTTPSPAATDTRCCVGGLAAHNPLTTAPRRRTFSPYPSSHEKQSGAADSDEPGTTGAQRSGTVGQVWGEAGDRPRADVLSASIGENRCGSSGATRQQDNRLTRESNSGRPRAKSETRTARSSSASTASTCPRRGARWRATSSPRNISARPASPPA